MSSSWLIIFLTNSLDEETEDTGTTGSQPELAPNVEGRLAKIRSKIARERFIRSMLQFRKSLRNLIPRKINNELYTFGDLSYPFIRHNLKTVNSDSGGQDELTGEYCDTISSFKKKGEFDICVHKNSLIYQRLCFLEEGSPITISGPYGSTKYLGGGAFYW